MNTSSLHHPLFPEGERPFEDKTTGFAMVSIRSLYVIDFQLGLVKVHLTPHFFLARAALTNENLTPAIAFYKAYRINQFKFSSQEARVDVDFFLTKVLNPNFGIPISCKLNGFSIICQDGFHRLAIHAAHGKKRIRATLRV